MMQDLLSIQWDILYILDGLDSPHGLAIKDDLEDYYKSEINPGRLYPNLDKLVEKGLVSKTQADKRTNSYSITPKGRRSSTKRDEWRQQHLDAPTEDS